MIVYELIKMTLYEKSWKQVLRSVYPEGMLGEYGFQSRLPLDDPKLAEIHQAFSSFGLTPVASGMPRDKRKNYIYTFIREYDETDWNVAEYFELRPSKQVGRLGIENGQVQLPGLDLAPDKIDVASAFFDEIILPERTKDLIDKQNLLGVGFRKADIIGDQTTDPDLVYKMHMGTAQSQPYSGEPWYSMHGSIELPPVSPSMRILDAKRNLVPAGTQQKHIRFDDSPYNFAEIHYRRDDVDHFPEFDLARTWESWSEQPRLIASKQFYLICYDLGLDFGWIPVRIDENEQT